MPEEIANLFLQCLTKIVLLLKFGMASGGSLKGIKDPYSQGNMVKSSISEKWHVRLACQGNKLVPPLKKN